MTFDQVASSIHVMMTMMMMMMMMMMFLAFYHWLAVISERCECGVSSLKLMVVLDHMNEVVSDVIVDRTVDQSLTMVSSLSETVQLLTAITNIHTVNPETALWPSDRDSCQGEPTAQAFCMPFVILFRCTEQKA